MNDLISRSALAEHFVEMMKNDKNPMRTEDFWLGIARAHIDIEEFPAANAEPAKHGEWLPDTKFGTDVMAENTICSVCGKGAFGQPDYCPHCGAIMDGGGDNA